MSDRSPDSAKEVYSSLTVGSNLTNPPDVSENQPVGEPKQRLNYNTFKSNIGIYSKNIKLFPSELRPVLDDEEKKTFTFYKEILIKKRQQQKMEEDHRCHEECGKRHRIPRRPRVWDDYPPGVERNNFTYGRDVYRNILGPTPDESILAGLQTVIDIIGLSDLMPSSQSQSHLASKSTNTRPSTRSSRRVDIKSMYSSQESSQEDFSGPFKTPRCGCPNRRFARPPVATERTCQESSRRPTCRKLYPKMSSTTESDTQRSQCEFPPLRNPQPNLLNAQCPCPKKAYISTSISTSLHNQNSAKIETQPKFTPQPDCPKKCIPIQQQQHIKHTLCIPPYIQHQRCNPPQNTPTKDLTNGPPLSTWCNDKSKCDAENVPPAIIPQNEQCPHIKQNTKGPPNKAAVDRAPCSESVPECNCTQGYLTPQKTFVLNKRESQTRYETVKQQHVAGYEVGKESALAVDKNTAISYQTAIKSETTSGATSEFPTKYAEEYRNLQETSIDTKRESQTRYETSKQEQVPRGAVTVNYEIGKESALAIEKNTAISYQTAIKGEATSCAKSASTTKCTQEYRNLQQTFIATKRESQGKYETAKQEQIPRGVVTVNYEVGKKSAFPIEKKTAICYQTASRGETATSDHKNVNQHKLQEPSDRYNERAMYQISQEFKTMDIRDSREKYEIKQEAHVPMERKQSYEVSQSIQRQKVQISEQNSWHVEITSQAVGPNDQCTGYQCTQGIKAAAIETAGISKCTDILKVYPIDESCGVKINCGGEDGSTDDSSEDPNMRRKRKHKRAEIRRKAYVPTISFQGEGCNGKEPFAVDMHTCDDHKSCAAYSQVEKVAVGDCSQQSCKPTKHCKQSLIPKELYATPTHLVDKCIRAAPAITSYEMSKYIQTDDSIFAEYCPNCKCTHDECCGPDTPCIKVKTSAGQAMCIRDRIRSDSKDLTAHILPPINLPSAEACCDCPCKCDCPVENCDCPPCDCMLDDTCSKQCVIVYGYIHGNQRLPSTITACQPIRSKQNSNHKHPKVKILVFPRNTKIPNMLAKKTLVYSIASATSVDTTTSRSSAQSTASSKSKPKSKASSQDTSKKSCCAKKSKGYQKTVSVQDPRERSSHLFEPESCNKDHQPEKKWKMNFRGSGLTMPPVVQPVIGICDDGKCGTSDRAEEIRYAMVRISVFSEYTTYEVLKSSTRKPKKMPPVVEGIFVTKR